MMPHTKSTGAAHVSAASLTLPVLLIALGGPRSPAAAATIDELVDCRTAVEEVYWRHRIWPEFNPTPKPPLAEVLPRAAITANMEAVLGKAAALEERWGRPITREALQAELERMARDSQAPEVLKELFAAAGSGERAALCLALPELVDRWIAGSYVRDERLHGELGARAAAAAATAPDLESLAASGAEVTDRVYVRRTDPITDLQMGVGEEAALPLDASAWDDLMARLSPVVRMSTGRKLAGATARLVGQVLEHTGGSALEETADGFMVMEVREAEAERVRVVSAHWGKEPLDQWWKREGGRFPLSVPETAGVVLPVVAGSSCVDGTWTPTRGAYLPDSRWFHSAVWTGSEMIVWGGEDHLNRATATGGRYDPATDRWLATSTGIGTPDARGGHTAVWTGTEMIVWGGYDDSFDRFATGGRYAPGTNSWTSTAVAGAPEARSAHTAVWTGTQMIVWGGEDAGTTKLDSGGVYTPSTNGWSGTSKALTLAPAARTGHSAVWTGSEMIIWGGLGSTQLNTGGRYTPGTDSWLPTAILAAPSARVNHTAVWTGTRMIVWGGADGMSSLATGSRYDPVGDAWSTITNVNAPSPRFWHSAVWTGNRMIIWGGLDSVYADSGGRYNPSTDSWAATAASGRPLPRALHTAVWSGSEMIVWGGHGTLTTLASGGRYNPTSNTWIPTTENAAPSSRLYHSAVWTGAEMIVWGGVAEQAVNTGGRYSPATNSWRATTTVGAPVERAAHSAIWTGGRMIVFGGTSILDLLDSGAEYDPVMDAWSDIPPAGVDRSGHSAVWTGTEMIIWGGYGILDALQSGGRYEPVGQNWSDTALPNAPAARVGHTAVWAGTEMIVWGGVAFPSSLDFATGGRYFPDTDVWLATFTSGAPGARSYHSAVWTGSEMIVWGGLAGGIDELNTGGRYRPGTGAWQIVPTAGAPAGRAAHTAVWTRAEMIVWGGFDGQGPTRTGARFAPGTSAWTPVTTSGAPAARSLHTAVWTGSEMIVWGGDGGTAVLTSGGRYCAPPPALVFAHGFEGG